MASGSDWSIGCYERTAAQLLPAAEVVVARAAPLAGELVVDVGCGTGNAALLAAARGARVIGVDPAPRLLGVARAEAAARELEATFVAGEAAALPLPEASADAVVSVFGIIFAPDAAAAASELTRVTRDGRIVLSAWIPGGAISELNRIGQEAVMSALGTPPPGRRLLPGTTGRRWKGCSSRTGMRSRSRSTGSPSPVVRRATISTPCSGVIRSRSPAAASSGGTAATRRSGRACSRFSKLRTRIPGASA